MVLPALHHVMYDIQHQKMGSSQILQLLYSKVCMFLCVVCGKSYTCIVGGLLHTSHVYTHMQTHTHAHTCTHTHAHSFSHSHCVGYHPCSHASVDYCGTATWCCIGTSLHGMDGALLFLHLLEQPHTTHTTTNAHVPTQKHSYTQPNTHIPTHPPTLMFSPPNTQTPGLPTACCLIVRMSFS